MDRWLFGVFSRAAQRFFAASEVPLGSSRNPRGQEGGGVSLFYFRICLRKISVRFFFKQEDNRITIRSKITF